MVIGATLIDKIIEIILNPIILLIFAAGFVLFLWGMVQFMQAVDSPGDRATGTKHMIWGLTGMFIMIAVQGILALIMDTFDIRPDDTSFGSGVQRAYDANDLFRRR